MSTLPRAVPSIPPTQRSSSRDHLKGLSREPTTGFCSVLRRGLHADLPGADVSRRGLCGLLRALHPPYQSAGSARHGVGVLAAAGESLGREQHDRLAGSLAAAVFCVTKGARIVRVHDVRAMVRVTRMAEALVGVSGGDEVAGRRRSDGTAV